MNPERKIKTSAGEETATQTADRINSIRADNTITSEGQAAAGRIAAARAKADNTITSESLAPQAEVQVTDPQTGTAMAGLGGALEAQTDSFAQGLADTTNQREAASAASTRDYQSLVANRTGLEGFSLQADQEAGVFEAESALKDINNKLRTEQLARRRSTELITSTGGQSKGQAQSQINNVNRESYSKQADMAIQQLAAQGMFNIASALADRKANAMFEQEQNQIDAAKITYEDNKDLYNKAEQREFETALTDRTNRVQAEKEQMQAVQNLALQAQMDGAPPAIVSEMMKSKTLADASALGGQFVGALDREQQRASIAQSYASIRSSNASADLNEAELVAYNNAQKDAESGILTGEQVGTAQTINKDFEDEPITKQYNDALSKFIVLEDTLANGIDGIQDLQLVYDFMKAVDPTSVVRETEFATAAETGNIFQGTFAKFNKSFGTGGFLPEEVKNDFIRASRQSFSAKETQYMNLKREKANQINQRLGINNGADYLTNYESAAPLSQSDVELAGSLSAATPEELVEIMEMSLEVGNTTTQQQ